MRARQLLALAAVASSDPVAAQSRVVPLPDSLGANFSIADSAHRSGSPDDYDAVLGVWHFTFQSRRPDGTFASPVTGHWSFRKRPGTRAVVEDQWRRDDPAQPFESGTLTYRAYNPARKLWEVQGTATHNDHPWLAGVGWSDGGNRYLVQYYGPDMIIRFRYLAIEPNRFLWRADMSPDRGATWTRDWWTMEVKRVGH